MNDIKDLTAQRWQVSEGTFFDFDKHQLIMCPCTKVDCVFAPTLNTFLAGLLSKCKTDNKAVTENPKPTAGRNWTDCRVLLKCVAIKLLCCH